MIFTKTHFFFLWGLWYLHKERMVDYECKMGSHASEGDKHGQTDHTQHKTYLEDTDKGRTVPQRADCERH